MLRHTYRVGPEAGTPKLRSVQSGAPPIRRHIRGATRIPSLVGMRRPPTPGIQIDVRSVLLFVAALSLACAKQQLPPIAQLSPEREARCRAVSDSIFANVPPEKLPDAGRPKSRPQVAHVPQSVPPGVPVRVAFLVRPDGAADTSTVFITGTDDARYRRDAMKMVSQVRFTPAEVDGCPVWSHVEVVSVRYAEVREMEIRRPTTH